MGGKAIQIQVVTTVKVPMPCRNSHRSSTTVIRVRREGVVFRHKARLMSTVVGVSLALLIPLFFSLNAEGATTSKTVLGTVYDQAGQPLSDARVTVQIWGGSWPDQDFLRTSRLTVTDSWGSYEVTISSNYWDPHNTIRVIATYDSTQGIRSVEADEETHQTLDVDINLTIPEVGGALGLLAMMVGCIVPIMIMLDRKRK